MKNFLFFITLFFSVAALNAGIIEKTYYFENVKIQQSGEYHLISFENTLLTGKTGEPTLPYNAIKLILPPGETATTIEFIGEQETQIPGYFKIYPHQPSRPLSDDSPAVFIINEEIYNTTVNYPEKNTGEIITEYMNGYAIGLSSFTPVKYNPATGTVSYYKEVKIRITTKPEVASAIALQNINSSKKSKERVKNFVQNKELLEQYPAASLKADDYQLLIITPSQFENSYQTLIDIYLERGIKTEVITTEYISANGTGQDDQEKIRNYIIQEYQSHSVEYVLLGGDVEHVPYRGFYCYVQSGSGYTDDDIPADLYYSALDGNWNTDGDNLWGEPGEDDLLPDIAVGRFSFSDATELSNMINKTISYQNSPVLGELRDPLLAGEHLYNDPETWGADYLELLIGHHEDNGYTTDGIPADHDIETMYERDAAWSGSDLIAKVNSGKQFIHHVGHANSSYVAHLYNSDITDANFYNANGVDHNFTIMQTHGCICGAFDNNDCILERMVSIQNFAVAVIGNSRYGWFNEGQTEGPAAHLHREMVDALYHEKMNHIGAAFMESKIQTSPWVTAPGQWEEGALRWNFYDINVLGDPALSVWTDEPITIQVSYQNSIPMGVSSTSVTVTSGGSPMENFACAIIKDGVLHGVGYTDASGNAQINFDPVFTTVGDAELIVSGYNCLPATYAVSIVPNSGSYVVYSAHSIDDSQGNNNGEVDFGESINLTIEVENVGSAQANNVQVTLATSDSYVTITDNFENYGDIPGNSTKSVTDGFAFDVASDIPDQHTVDFDIEITGESKDTWNSSFSITINAPILEFGSMTIDDNAGGDGNGRLDPGETADISVPVTNNGHSDSPDASALLSSVSSYVTINSGSASLGVINTGGSANAIFNISIDPLTPIGTSVDLTVDVDAGDYDITNTFYQNVGLILEDWEAGNFYSFPWAFAGDADWFITDVDPYEGTYCSQSGDISDSETSEMEVELYVTTADDISFYRKVSSESSYDYLRFYIDGTQQEQWSGEVAWSQVSYPVSVGTHIFKWIYYKDSSVSNGSDCAWVDYIIFPPVSPPPSPPNIEINPESFEVTLPPGATQNEILSVSNLGDLDLEFSAQVVYLGGSKNTAMVSPADAPKWTGTTDGSTFTANSEVRGVDTEDGWFMFDVSSIPSGATINSIEFYGYVNYTYYPYWSMTPVSNDPLTTDAATLYNDINAEATSGYYLYQNESSSFATGWHNYTLGGTANTDLEAALSQGWFAMGMASRDNSATYYINWDGWNETNPPYLIVDYTYNPLNVWLTVDGSQSTAGLIASGENQDIVVGFNATSLTEGIYLAEIRLSSNDPVEPLVIIPCTLHVSAGFDVSLTVMLEGPYNGTDMNTDLAGIPEFPLAQPFNTSPWHYNGTESVGSLPNTDIVDWVLVELRDAADATSATNATVIATQAGFLLNNGTIVSMDGSSPLFYNLAISQNLFAKVYSRNHLDILSENSLTGIGEVYNYDFTTGSEQVYGGALGYKYLGNSKWGMVSGDGNCDGEVSPLDLSQDWEQQAGEAGYNLNDHNLDGQVDNQDKDDYLLPNLEKVSQMPD